MIRRQGGECVTDEPTVEGLVDLVDGGDDREAPSPAPGRVDPAGPGRWTGGRGGGAAPEGPRVGGWADPAAGGTAGGAPSPTSVGRARRARCASTATLRATVNSHDRTGPRSGSSACGCRQARNSVSWTMSSALPRSPLVSRTA